MTNTIQADTTEIRRHPDGSINTRHYMKIGRQRRSEAFYDGGRVVAKTGPMLARMTFNIRFRIVSVYLRNSAAQA